MNSKMQPFLHECFSYSELHPESYVQSYCVFCWRSYSKRALKPRETPAVMQPNLNELGAHAGSSLTLTLQPQLVTRAPVPVAAADNKDTRVHINSGEASGGSSSRRCRVNSHSHSRSQPQGRSQAQPRSSSETELDPPETDLESEPSSSFSEIRCLIRWLQKSFPFLIILCAKLVIQHALGEYILSKARCIHEEQRKKTVWICAYFPQDWLLGLACTQLSYMWIKAFKRRFFFR